MPKSTPALPWPCRFYANSVVTKIAASFFRHCIFNHKNLVLQVPRAQLKNLNKTPYSAHRVSIKEEKIDDEFLRPGSGFYGRQGHFESIGKRGPCTIQKVPSLSDLSDPESSSSLGKKI